MHSYPTKTDHSRTNKYSITALPRPAPRSGWGVSLRRDSLSQTSPLPPRRGLNRNKKATRVSLKRDPSLAWASCVLAQNTPWSPKRPLAQKALGEPLHISPGRVKLAWASLSVSATVRTCNAHSRTQQRFQSNPDIHSNAQSQRILKPRQYKLNTSHKKDSSFPYLE